MAPSKEPASPADKKPAEKELKKDLPIGKGKEKEKDAKKDEPTEEELSEEDQQLKSELEMLVERLKEDDKSLYKPALAAIKDFIRTSTSSMTAVPKPLKFLRPLYPGLCELYDKWEDEDNKWALADVLSVIGMTYAGEDRVDSLKYRLLAPTKEAGSWGHEYVRHLALEIGQEYQRRVEQEEDVDVLKELSLAISPFFITHNAEAEAVDLLCEVEIIEQIVPLVDENTYQRVCLYMTSMVNYLAPPDDVTFLRTVHAIYRRFNKLPQAMTIAVRLNDTELIREDLDATDDAALKKQLAFIVSRQEIPIEDIEDEDIRNCLSNARLSEHFLLLAKELNILDPKIPEDIYKSHLENTRGAAAGLQVDSAKQNLASSFVNGFVNAGFGVDKLILTEEAGNSWVYKNKDEGMTSAAASIGLLKLWDTEGGMNAVNSFLFADDNNVKAGGALAAGILQTGIVNDETDNVLALLSDADFLESSNVNIKVSAILGLGLAYAGKQREDVLNTILPFLQDSSNNMQIASMAALALGLIYVGSSNGDVTGAILEQMMERSDEQLKEKWGKFFSAALAILYIGRQEDADATLETLKAIEQPLAKATAVLVDACAYAGTGNVLKFQSMLHLCSEKTDPEKEGEDLFQSYATLGLALIGMGEEVGAEMSIRQFGHLMHYGESGIRKTVPLALGLLSASNPQMKIYDTLSRYSHDNDLEVAMNAIFAMGIVGAGTNNARLAQLLRQLASYYHRDPNSLFMVRIAQGLLHLGKGTLSLNPFHTDRQILSRTATAGLVTVLVTLLDARGFVLDHPHHYLLYFLATAIHPRFLITLDEDLKPLPVNVRVGQAVDIVGQAGRPKTITGWQTQSTPVLLSHGERAELEDDQYISLTNNLEGIAILRKNPEWDAGQKA